MPETFQTDNAPLDLSTVKATGHTKRTSAKKEDDLNGKAKAHQRYYAAVLDADGAPVLDAKGAPKRVMVPGATTVLGVMNKGYLVPWANRLGLEGIDSDKYRNETASIGTLAHYLVQCDLTGETPNLEHYTPYQMERAAFAFVNWQEWRKGKEVVPSLVEGRLQSNNYRYGGTVDFYGTVDDAWTLLDFKTSEAIYLEHKVQVTSYTKLLIESARRVQKVIIIRLGRGVDDTLETHELGLEAMKRYWQVFEHCLALYRLQKEIRGKGE